MQLDVDRSHLILEFVSSRVDFIQRNTDFFGFFIVKLKEPF